MALQFCGSDYVMAIVPISAAGSSCVVDLAWLLWPTGVMQFTSHAPETPRHRIRRLEEDRWCTEGPGSGRRIALAPPETEFTDQSLARRWICL
jgi:hypothetical protein